MHSDQLDVFPVLSNLTSVRRFAMTVMFLSSSDKQGFLLTQTVLMLSGVDLSVNL